MRRDKITAAAFAAAAVLMFSGCSGRQEETAVETAEETAAETEAVESSGEAEAESAKESGPEELVIYDDTEQADDGLTFDESEKYSVCIFQRSRGMVYAFRYPAGRKL